MSLIYRKKRAESAERLAAAAIVLLLALTLFVSIGAQEAVTSNGASVFFQGGGDVAASNGVSVSFQNSSTIGNQGISIGFGDARHLNVTPPYPTQRDTVQAVGSGFTHNGNVVLYLLNPDNTFRVVGSGVADNLGQVTINYITSCANTTGNAVFRMLDVALGAYSNTYTIYITPNSECAVYGNTALVKAYPGELRDGQTPVILTMEYTGMSGMIPPGQATLSILH